MKNGAIIVVILVLLIISGGIYYFFKLNNSESSTAPGASKAEQGAEISIRNFQFIPASLSVKLGDKVTWINEDEAPHTIVSDNGKFESQNLAEGDSYEFTFAEAGIYNYHCGIHSGMKGKFIVS